MVSYPGPHFSLHFKVYKITNNDGENKVQVQSYEILK